MELVPWMVGLVAITCIGWWMQEKGWINLRRAGNGSALSNAMLEIHALIEPAKQYELAQRYEEHEEGEDERDPARPKGRAPGKRENS